MYSKGNEVVTELKVSLGKMANTDAIACVTVLHALGAISDDEHYEMLAGLLEAAGCTTTK